MTYADVDRRMTKLEGRVSDIEEGHGGSIYHLTRDMRRHELITRRLAVQANAIGHAVTMINNSLGRSMAMILERMELPPVPIQEIIIPEVVMPTEEEADASFEEEL
ncbi:hypothetical protein [Nocardia alni]|uniref:hypothetical protein n=1 Tax=Nocardia alni TaxID=2815723 RepID=UPI001C227923|nr:hypothetical protein [Nocardia alni]